MSKSTVSRDPGHCMIRSKLKLGAMMPFRASMASIPSKHGRLEWSTICRRITILRLSRAWIHRGQVPKDRGTDPPKANCLVTCLSLSIFSVKFNRVHSQSRLKASIPQTDSGAPVSIMIGGDPFPSLGAISSNLYVTLITGCPPAPSSAISQISSSLSSGSEGISLLLGEVKKGCTWV